MLEGLIFVLAGIEQQWTVHLYVMQLYRSVLYQKVPPATDSSLVNFLAHTEQRAAHIRSRALAMGLEQLSPPGLLLIEARLITEDMRSFTGTETIASRLKTGLASLIHVYNGMDRYMSQCEERTLSKIQSARAMANKLKTITSNPACRATLGITDVENITLDDF